MGAGGITEGCCGSPQAAREIAHVKAAARRVMCTQRRYSAHGSAQQQKRQLSVRESRRFALYTYSTLPPVMGLTLLNGPGRPGVRWWTLGIVRLSCFAGT